MMPFAAILLLLLLLLLAIAIAITIVVRWRRRNDSDAAAALNILPQPKRSVLAPQAAPQQAQSACAASPVRPALLD